MAGSLLALIPLVFTLLILLKTSGEWEQFHVVLLGLVSVIGFFACEYFVPKVKVLCLKADMFGRDINKDGLTKIPEALGIVPGTILVTCLILCGPLFPHEMSEYNAATTSICMMILLGFADDVLDLRWAVKIMLSLWATLPLLMAYDGPTNIIVPKPLHDLLGTSLHLGFLYHVYMALFAVFCTNSINIYAGINGLEAGQSLIISFAVLIHNILQLGGEYHADHVLSIVIVLPFSAVTLGLLVYNWYPSKVFVGDTYTYFAGMTLAVAGILGHFSKTLMLFFIPQLLNFLISLPQLFNTRWLPCPRHRLPKRNPDTNKLHGVPTNWNLLNVALAVIGPRGEHELCVIMLLFQVLCCGIGLAIRYHHTMTNVFYDM